MKNKTQQFINGFTLAEVLITLVIIGVIAALTIPTAINNMKEQEFKSQFKKTYSTIVQAMNKTELNDFYGYAQCYYGVDGVENQMTECPAFFDAFAKNLQVQKVCRGNSLADGCVPVYKSYNTASGCSYFNENNISNNNHTFVLSDGQIIIPWRVNAGGMALFLVDINGHKGPNAYGKDLFSFSLLRSETSGVYMGYGRCEFRVSGGKTTEQMIQYSLAGKK